jgi:hypothetical protein
MTEQAMGNIDVQGDRFGRETVYCFILLAQSTLSAQIVKLVIVISSETHSCCLIGIRQDKLVLIRSVQLPIIINQLMKAYNMFSKFGCIVHIGQSHQASECSMNESQRTLSEGSDLSAFADCYLFV